MIKGFQISDGRWVVDQSDIIQEVEQYYNAVFAMHPLKAPGVDAICFSKNVREEEKVEISSLLGQRQRNEYLGLPAVVGRSKKRMLEFIKERVKTKIKGWKGKILSTAGKEIMLKSVLAAIRTYALSCFQLLDGLCSNDRLIWHHTKIGNYEVKSGYYIAKDLIDAGLLNDDGRASIGIVALDSLGNLVHAHGSPIQFVGKVMTTEAIAIRKALKYAISKGWKRVKILSDAKNVVDMIQKRVTTSWEIEVLCEDIWKLSSMFNHVEFIYISRFVNKIADRLARYSISLLKEISWEKFFPSWIIQDAKDMFKLCIPLMQ
ncbi:hypothetical protein KY290_010888 [Solanum tuberosum]|uniref:RNase H type-1 domain-containing protein n=1 Tax=Solanum tuberosum TaxID=4113 RepID=A0ABQ7VZ35_SOLTU|nr:hypothetical protein KY290_010888 [Solanum tuberosum]